MKFVFQTCIESTSLLGWKWVEVIDQRYHNSHNRRDNLQGNQGVQVDNRRYGTYPALIHLQAKWNSYYEYINNFIR